MVRLILRPVLGLALAALVATPLMAQSTKDRVARLEAEMAQMRAASGGNTAVLSRLDNLEREIRTLTARLEELHYKVDRIAEDAKLRFDDIEFRLTELEGGDIANLQPSKPLGGGAVSGGAVGTGAVAVSISERGELDRAIEDVKQGRYDQGEERLQSFLNTYGQTPLKAEALYWLGESQLTRGDYRAAARSFLNGYNADLKGETAPRTLMKLGVSLGRLGQYQDACLTLKEVGTQFPAADTGILEQAAQEADQLACG